MYGWSVSSWSKAGIGSGKCIEFQNQSLPSSASRRRSSNSAQYGYISSQPSQPDGVSIEKGLGNASTSDVAVAIDLSSVAWSLKSQVYWFVGRVAVYIRSCLTA